VHVNRQAAMKRRDFRTLEHPRENPADEPWRRGAAGRGLVTHLPVVIRVSTHAVAFTIIADRKSTA